VPTINPEMLHEVLKPEIGKLQGRVENIETGCHGGISEVEIDIDVLFLNPSAPRALIWSKSAAQPQLGESAHSLWPQRACSLAVATR
jgi:hypothetical protein